MFRTAALLGIVLGCAFIGLQAERKLKRRYETVRQMLNDINALSMSMQYSAKPLEALIRECTSKETAVFWEHFLDALNESTVSGAWKHAMRCAVREDRGFSMLCAEELTIFEEYARGLGGSDRHTQAKNAAILEKRLETVVSASLDTYNRKGRIYRSMGLLCGFAVAILLW